MVTATSVLGSVHFSGHIEWLPGKDKVTHAFADLIMGSPPLEFTLYTMPVVFNEADPTKPNELSFGHTFLDPGPGTFKVRVYYYTGPGEGEGFIGYKTSTSVIIP